jgi:hypothetical protein
METLCAIKLVKPKKRLTTCFEIWGPGHGVIIACVCNKTNNRIVLFKIYMRKNILLSCLVGSDSTPHVLGSILSRSEPTHLAFSLTNLEGWQKLEEL